MREFQPGEDSLSPLPVTARACPLPYGVEWDDLRPCLPGFRRGSRALVTHELQGMRKGANTCVKTLEYHTFDGEIRSVAAFFKQVRGSVEREKHAFLQARNVPVPRMLRAVSRPDAEVLVFEFLPRIGIRSAEAADLLRLIARLNAVEVPPDGIFLPPPGRPETEFGARISAALQQAGAPDPQRWFSAYGLLGERVRSLPTALNHGELYFQQVGWSGRQLVLFDLETVAWRPRFTDVAGVIAPLAQRTGRSEAELFGAYLRALSSGVDESRAYRELLVVRAVSAFWSLPWRLEAPEERGTAAQIVQDLGSDLRALGLLSG